MIKLTTTGATEKVQIDTLDPGDVFEDGDGDIGIFVRREPSGDSILVLLFDVDADKIFHYHYSLFTEVRPRDGELVVR